MPTKFDPTSPAVQAHLTIEQSVIQRMSTNSTGCKAWCITLVSAIFIVVADKDKPNFALFSLIPTILFFVMDGYYLAMERMFRASYNGFLTKLHAGTVEWDELFIIRPKGEMFLNFLQSLVSFSILPFYVTLVFMALIVKYVIV